MRYMLTWSATKSKNQKMGKIRLQYDKSYTLGLQQKKPQKIKIKNKKDLIMAIRHRLGQKTKQKKQQTKTKGRKPEKTKVDQTKLFATGNIGDKAKSIQTRQITEQ